MKRKNAQLLSLKRSLERKRSLPLYRFRRENGYRPVLGEGNADARLMFVGEAPGKNEAEQGRPFCGAAGKILDEFLTAAGLDRTNVYVTSIVHDRPPENRDPTSDEIAAYVPYLDAQIDVIKPTILAPLGRYAARHICWRYAGADVSSAPMSELHASMMQGNATYGPVRICPLYHPAAALYNGSKRATLRSGMRYLHSFLSS